MQLDYSATVELLLPFKQTTADQSVMQKHKGTYTWLLIFTGKHTNKQLHALYQTAVVPRTT